MNEKKEKWYENEILVCAAIVAGIFGIIFGLIKLGVSTQNAVIVGIVLILGLCLLPLIDPIQDAIKWIKSKRQKEMSG